MNLAFARKKSRGFSLLIVFVIVAVALMILAGVMGWVGSNGAMSARFREYHTSLGAAEAGTEKVIASMARDFLAATERSDFQGADLTTLDGNIATYEGQYPLSGDLSGAPNYEFAGPTLGTDATYVARVADRGWTNLTWKYTNFNGYAATYRVVSNARNTDSDNNITSAFRQDIQLASIPLFGFAIFYGGNNDMEFCPSSGNFNITGPVHSNGSIYSKPNSPASITYAEAVTASGTITNESSPLDPTLRALGTVAYDQEKDVRVSPLNLPIGTNNSSINLHKIIEIPPGSELATSPMGQQRYYNKADLIIRVTTNAVIATSGAYNNFATTVLWSEISSFVNTNVYYTNAFGTNLPYDLREGRQLRLTEIRISNMHSASTKSALLARLGRNVNTLYVADLRGSAGIMSAIRIRSATTLNPGGSGAFTLATPNPLYIRGSFNTTAPKPASLVCDAITVLSSSSSASTSSTFDLSSSDTSLGSRVAPFDRTINAGVITGIVPSNGAAYSGGVENVFRFLEDWSSRTFTFNGSIVVIYASQQATAPWGSPNVYSPPSRVFNFDSNFTDSTKLPSGTPFVRTLIRDQRIAIQSNSTY